MKRLSSSSPATTAPTGPGARRSTAPAGLRGFKRHLYEGGIRAPFIARWPGVMKPGTAICSCGHVDFLATACELAGVSRAEGHRRHQHRAHAAAANRRLRRTNALYWEIYEGPSPFQQAVRMGQWKGYRTALKGPLELYDLRKDPAEKDNVAATHPDVVKRIEAIMSASMSAIQTGIPSRMRATRCRVN